MPCPSLSSKASSRKAPRIPVQGVSENGRTPAALGITVETKNPSSLRRLSLEETRNYDLWQSGIIYRFEHYGAWLKWPIGWDSRGKDQRRDRPSQQRIQQVVLTKRDQMLYLARGPRVFDVVSALVKSFDTCNLGESGGSSL